MPLAPIPRSLRSLLLAGVLAPALAFAVAGVNKLATNAIASTWRDRAQAHGIAEDSQP